MQASWFRALLILIAALFTAAFTLVVIPPLLESRDVLGAFAAGFVNPYAAGYAMDTISCWCVLTVWVVHEARAKGIRHGWVAVLLGIVPGVATGFAVYLLLRMRQEGDQAASTDRISAP
ncbi:DUF2834 domain-containing protein [Aquabacterium sp.]|uniref:DUF2834 domain-containing protein n=1 Tax=Aquabacterium sp. TaxID=1872578 RepID=UPI002487AB5A|nr:DUF2834 domain-containing protein [Aquabacterium sp.]MDI1257681.1 DUF2834 domain-containing protein [Aquabacterium sp.]